jgi:diguanylate cyclase (GGDEF)-like protein
LPLIVLLVLHGAFFVAGALLAATGRLGAGYPPAFDSWMGLIHFETLAFVVGTAIFAVAMVKEQQEMEQKTAARVDSLTGVASRRAFLENAGALIDRSSFDHKPLSLIVFDLDRFKTINDNYGHAMGDRVLEQFGEIARNVLRGSDVVGRMGGEEFAIALPDSTARATLAVAERIRQGFAESCRAFEMDGFRPTLSGGIAEIGGPAGSTLDSVYAAADQALYRAKAEGRDRIVMSDADGETVVEARDGVPSAAIAARAA